MNDRENDLMNDRHLTEDELILHSYGDVDRADRARVDAHLAECAECQVAKEQLVRILAMVDTAPPVEAPLGFERTVWARLEPALDSNRSGWRTFFWLPQWALAGGLAALLVVAFVAGRFSNGTTPVTTMPPAAVVADFEPEGVLRTAVGDHLDRTQMVLVELANAESDGASVFASEQARAGDLVAANRVIRQSALQSGDGQIVDILEDLERVLLEIANAPADVTSNDLTDLQTRIAREDLLFRLRVIASEMRQRNIPDRATGDPNARRKMPTS
jgi:anti-sigma factor RsiW